MIRRATFDLTGLPPTPEEVDAFLADDTADAYERLIDRLLASPRYGQRWGRHWLDLVRYAESDGYRQDAFRPHAWRYRDYVVRAFNTDKPYDRFLTEQLAGDELDPDDPELRVATGYLRLGTYEYNQRNVRGQWADILNDITDVTGEVFLGLSIGCARCHDHKFDPILQKDYYRLQAFFTPLLPRDDLTLATPRQWADYQAKRAAWKKAAADILRQIEALERPYRDKGTASAIAKFPDEIKAILAKPETDRSLLERQLGALAFRQIAFEHDQVPSLLKGTAKARWDELHEALKRYDDLRPVAPDPVLTATDLGPVSPPTVIPGDRKQEPIEPGYLSVLDPEPARIEPSPAAPQSTGRRLALARWLSRPDNPLSTRVIVNRVWQYHFGRGLAGTSSDFGRMGESPSHPELLDWLATEFVANGWHIKPLHRLILTSATYRQAAQRSESDLAAGQRIDPENRLLWKRTVQRLDAEEIRDAMLAASGELDPAIGGPSVPTSRPRRTIDTRVIRNSRDALLDAFDAADGTSSTPRRNTTTTATQALLLINGEWALARAKALAARLERLEPSSTDDRDRIVLAYRLAFGRQPEPDEIAEAMAFIKRQAKLLPHSAQRSITAADHDALVDFCHVLLNSNEFLYVATERRSEDCPGHGTSDHVLHRVTPLTRRDWLLQAGAGFGALAAWRPAGARRGCRTGARRSHSPISAPWRRPATAKSVIFLFMEGGPSHLDTFDPKPELNRLAGQSLPPSFKPVITPMGEGRAPLMASRRKWKQHGQSGIWVSDWLPHIATCVDDIAVIRSCWSNGLNHVGGVCQMNTGSTLAGRPSMGSWVTYGLGTENANLPGLRRDARFSAFAGGRRSAELGHWLHAGGLPGDALGQRCRAVRQPENARRDRPGAARREARALGPAQSPPSPRPRRPVRARRPDQELRAGVPHASRGTRGRRPVARDGRNPRPLRPGRSGGRDHRTPLPAGSPAGRAWRAVRPDLLRRGE